MLLLTLNLLLNSYVHISSIRKLNKNTYKTYRIINNSYIIDITSIVINLYKLYKLLFLFSTKNIYITFINTLKLNNYKFIFYLLKFTNSNCYNKIWIKGLLTNKQILPNILILYLLINKIIKSDIYFSLDNRVTYLYYKYKFLKCLKNTKFSKFLFFFNLDLNIIPVKESILSNKFTIGLCDLNFRKELTDFQICCNNVNYKSINLILKFVITSIVQGKSYLKHRKNKKKKKK